MRSMNFYSKAAMEGAMMIQEVILRAVAEEDHVASEIRLVEDTPDSLTPAATPGVATKAATAQVQLPGALRNLEVERATSRIGPSGSPTGG